MNTAKAQTIFIVSFIFLFAIFGIFIGLDYNSILYGCAIAILGLYIANSL